MSNLVRRRVDSILDGYENQLLNTIGFSDFMESFLNFPRNDQYPPYNIIQNPGGYTIEVALAGFSKGDVDIVIEDETLKIVGKTQVKTEQNDVATDLYTMPEGSAYLHRGIAKRQFELRFKLSSQVEVDSAKFNNGMLSIEVKKIVPEHLKPRKIEIN